MWTTYATTVRAVLRTPSAVAWALAFPIVLATVFNFMFEPLRAGDAMSVVPVAVVADDAWERSPFSEVVAALGGQDGSELLLEIREVTSEHEARVLLEAGEVDGVYAVDEHGAPKTIVAPLDSPAHAIAGSSYEVTVGLSWAWIWSMGIRKSKPRFHLRRY